MMIFRETKEEMFDAGFAAEQQLDKINHSIPEWVHRQFPQHTLAEKIKVGFEEIGNRWFKMYSDKSKHSQDIEHFLVYVLEKHGFNFTDEYFKYLASKR